MENERNAKSPPFLKIRINAKSHSFQTDELSSAKNSNKTFFDLESKSPDKVFGNDKSFERENFKGKLAEIKKDFEKQRETRNAQFELEKKAEIEAVTQFYIEKLSECEENFQEQMKKRLAIEENK